MLANLHMQNGLLLSEKVMFEVGKKFGKQTAHHLVYACAMQQAAEKCLAFKSGLLAHPVLAACITEQDLDHWLDPAYYTGCAAQKVDDVIRFAEQSGHLISTEECEV